MESALRGTHVHFPRAALATGAVVVATFAAAAAAWSALPGNATDAPAVATRPAELVPTMHGTQMAGMNMRGMRMPMPATAARR